MPRPPESSPDSNSRSQARGEQRRRFTARDLALTALGTLAVTLGAGYLLRHTQEDSHRAGGTSANTEHIGIPNQRVLAFEDYAEVKSFVNVVNGLASFPAGTRVFFAPGPDPSFPEASQRSVVIKQPFQNENPMFADDPNGLTWLMVDAPAIGVGYIKLGNRLEEYNKLPQPFYLTRHGISQQIQTIDDINQNNVRVLLSVRGLENVGVRDTDLRVSMMGLTLGGIAPDDTLSEMRGDLEHQLAVSQALRVSYRVP